MTFDLDIISVSDSKSVGTISVSGNKTISDIKPQIAKLKNKLSVERQSVRTEPKGKALSDKTTLDSLGIKAGSKIYVKDLGPQLGWRSVFLSEYSGPLLLYLLVSQRPWIFYGDVKDVPISFTTQLACICWTAHYVKRILETLFVHRFSHSTMPIRNLFKNCSYYWSFSVYVAYYVNHPLYTEPPVWYTFVGLAGFIFGELGNLSIHLALRDLRPAGTRTRNIPKPNGNPLTMLFDYVSCPHYTYEFIAWVSFMVMTKSLPAGLFAAAGMYQMIVWALNKHRAYKKEFPNYPKNRKSIVPFLI